MLKSERYFRIKESICFNAKYFLKQLFMKCIHVLNVSAKKLTIQRNALDKQNEDVFCYITKIHGATMRKSEKIIKIITESMRLFALAFLGIFFVFVVNHYYQIKNYASTLYEELNIFIFFDKNSKSDEKILENLNSKNLISVKEYINATEAYSKAIEKNPLLKDISLPIDSTFLQAYAIVKPEPIPDSGFLTKMKDTLEGIAGIDEIVFDVPNFIHYANVQKQLLVYEKTFFIVISTFFVFLTLKFVLVYIVGLDMIKKTKRFFLFFLSTCLGFLVFWAICKCVSYSLLMSGTAVLLIILFTCALGIMLDKVDKE